MLTSALPGIRRFISNSSVLVVGGVWFYYSLSNIEALF